MAPHFEGSCCATARRSSPQAHRLAVVEGNNAVAVELDLVHPVRTSTDSAARAKTNRWKQLTDAAPVGGRRGAVIKLGKLVMILELHRQGISVSAIARQLGIDRKTVRVHIGKGLMAPAYKGRPPHPPDWGILLRHIWGNYNWHLHEREGALGKSWSDSPSMKEVNTSRTASLVGPYAADVWPVASSMDRFRRSSTITEPTRGSCRYHSQGTRLPLKGVSSETE